MGNIWNLQGLLTIVVSVMDPKLLMKILQVTFTAGPEGRKNWLNWHIFPLRWDSWDQMAVHIKKIPSILDCGFLWFTAVYSLLFILIQSCQLQFCCWRVSSLEALGESTFFSKSVNSRVITAQNISLTETSKSSRKNFKEMTDNAGTVKTEIKVWENRECATLLKLPFDATTLQQQIHLEIVRNVTWIMFLVT